MAGGSMTMSHLSILAVVCLVFLLPGMVVDANTHNAHSLPYRLLSRLLHHEEPTIRRTTHPHIRMVPHRDQDMASTLKAGSSLETGQEENKLMKGLLSELPVAQQTGCTRVGGTSVYCTGPDITKIPADMGNGTVKIFILNTSLAELPNGAFQNYSDLQTLWISDSPLAKVEAGAFKDISNLKSLILGLNPPGVALMFENNTFEGVSSLEHVTLSSVGLTDMPENLLKNATNLTSLSLADNELTSLTALPAGIGKLEKLYLQKNKIATIDPSAFDETQGIKELVLDNNALGVFDAKLMDNLMSLTRLVLSSNKITTFNGNICNKVTALRDLYLARNKLTDVNFAGCASIETLDITGNGIKTIQPGALTNMGKLKHLKLGENQLNVVPNLMTVPQLESLNISWNNITVIKNGDLNKLGYLRTLTATSMGNGFKVETGALNLFLQDVDFSFNDGIDITTATLLGPASIVNIKLHGCGIKKLDGTAIMNKNSLQTLDISKNPLVCDCNSTWLVKGREEKKPWAMGWGVHTPSPKCGTPGWLPYSMLTIPELTMEDFACVKPVVDPTIDTNITVNWGAGFRLAANLTQGYPKSVWKYPDGDYSYSVGSSIFYEQHHVETYFSVDEAKFTDTVNHFTMTASNLVGDTKITFQVNQNPKPSPPNGANNGAALNCILLVFLMVTALLLKY